MTDALMAAHAPWGPLADHLMESGVPEGEAYLRAVCLRPADDGPRLAYAGWLERTAETVPCRKCKGYGWLLDHEGRGGEHSFGCTACGGDSAGKANGGRDGSGTVAVTDGNRERAAFIRKQVAGELAALRLTWLVPFEAWFGCQPHQTARYAAKGVAWAGDAKDRWVIFRRGFAHTLEAPLAAFWGEWPCPSCKGGWFDTNRDPALCPTCRQGRVAGPAPGLAAVLAGNPVQVVKVIDKAPHRAGEAGWGWQADDYDPTGYVRPFPAAAVLPAALARRLEGYCPAYAYFGYLYDSPAEAVAALSAALLEGARE